MLDLSNDPVMNLIQMSDVMLSCPLSNVRDARLVVKVRSQKVSILFLQALFSCASAVRLDERSDDQKIAKPSFV